MVHIRCEHSQSLALLQAALPMSEPFVSRPKTHSMREERFVVRIFVIGFRRYRSGRLVKYIYICVFVDEAGGPQEDLCSLCIVGDNLWTQRTNRSPRTAGP